MMAVEIKTMGIAGHTLRVDTYITPNIGEALNEHAPDPAQGSSFQVRVITKAVKVIHA